MVNFRLTRIELPEWATQRSLSISSVMVAEYAAIQRHRDELLRVVHLEAEAYPQRPGTGIRWLRGGISRIASRVTGMYDVGSESYPAHRDPAWFQIQVMCRCLEYPKLAGTPREDDYLGLEVWLKCVPGQKASQGQWHRRWRLPPAMPLLSAAPLSQGQAHVNAGGNSELSCFFDHSLFRWRTEGD